MKPDNSQAFWQKWSVKHGLAMNRIHRSVYQRLCQQIRPNLSRNMNVLELACGTGQLSQCLSSQVHLWEATDFSPAVIQAANRASHSVRLHFSVQDAAHLPYGPESFDAVVIPNALQSMPQPEEILSEAYRVLKPGGTLFAPTAVQDNKQRLPLRWLKQRELPVYHHWNRQNFCGFLEQNHFHITNSTLLPGSPLSLCCAVGIKCG
jgi:ubiquinone/menaquinone biosynthesis C-methylase UbiE